LTPRTINPPPALPTIQNILVELNETLRPVVGVKRDDWAHDPKISQRVSQKAVPTAGAADAAAAGAPTFFKH